MSSTPSPFLLTHGSMRKRLHKTKTRDQRKRSRYATCNMQHAWSVLECETFRCFILFSRTFQNNVFLAAYRSQTVQSSRLQGGRRRSLTESEANGMREKNRHTRNNIPCVSTHTLACLRSFALSASGHKYDQNRSARDCKMSNTIFSLLRACVTWIDS